MRLRNRAAVILAGCLLVGGAVTGASALASHGVRGPLAKPGGGGLPTPPPGNIGVNGLKIDKTLQSVTKAKVTFGLPPLKALSYTQAAVEQPPKPPFWTDVLARVYVISPTGAQYKFGVFPTTTVHMLSFGTIPVTAKVHIQQLRKGKDPVPLIVKVRYTGGFVPVDGLPCSPSLCRYTEAAHATGPVDVRIDDLEVDQVPVDVGPNCHTSSPATLNLVSKAGYYSQAVSPPYIPDDEYLPFVNGGTFQGPVNVPDFTGCKNGGDDLSALVSGMVAGPGNHLLVHQKGPLGPYPPK